MSQHDMVVADAPGATVRADINGGLQALASTCKGPSAPSTPYAGQLWLDDDTPSSAVWALKQYDGTDWIALGLLDTSNNRFIANDYQATDVASASTIDLDACTGAVVDVTGTATITAATLSQGRWRIVRFTGALTLTHGASLVLPGAANITTAAGDYAVLVGYASSVVRCVGYFSGGLPLLAATQAQMEAGSSTAAVVTPARQHHHPSAAKFWVYQSDATDAASYNVSSITDNGTGDYTVNFTTAFSSANYAAVFGAQSAGVFGAHATGGHTTGSLRVLNITSNTGAATDVGQGSVVGYGDQ